jgi:hypothetical protein
MTGPTDFRIGSDVSCSDGACGVLARVVIDPVARALTHLVVEHGREGRLVPVDLVASTAEEVRLSCTTAQFEQLEAAEETQFLPGGDGRWGYGQDQMLSQPYYGFGGPALGMSGMGMGMGTPGPQVVTNDRVPTGEVEVRRGDHVYAPTAPSGGYKDLWSIRATIALRTSCSTRATCGGKKGCHPNKGCKGRRRRLRLNVSKDEVRDLPEVGFLGSTPSQGQK